MAFGLAACASVLPLSGALASASKPVKASAVTVSGRTATGHAYSNGFQVANPKSQLECAVVRLSDQKGYYRDVLQKLSPNPSGGVLQALVIQARAGTTSHVSSKPGGPYMQYLSSKQTWQAGNSEAGSGTIKISADGRSGSVNATLGSGNSIGNLHVTASWACTSKIEKGTS